MPTLRQIAAEMVADLACRRRSTATRKALRSVVSIFLQWLERNHGITEPEHLLREHVLAYQRQLCTRTGRGGRPMKSASINHNLWGVRLLAERLHRDGLAGPELPATIEYLKMPPKLPTVVLNHAQVRRLLDAIDPASAEGQRDMTVVEVLYSCGLRVGELVRLTLQDVDFEQATLRVMGKGDKERMVPVGKTALRLLLNWVRAVRPFLPGARDSEALFLNRRGKPMGVKTVQGRLPLLAAKAGIRERVTPHAMRRSCATEMIRADANLWHVRELLGHESVDTLKPYVRLSITDLRKTHARCHPREQDASNDGE